MVFLENDRDLGVKNGTLGTVKAVEPDALHVELDGSMLSPGDGVGLVKIDTNSYQSLDHGYATTIHKNQGAPRGSIDKAVAAAVMNAARWDEGIAAVGKPEGCVFIADASALVRANQQAFTTCAEKRWLPTQRASCLARSRLPCFLPTN